MKVSDLRNAFEAGRPLVEQWLDIAEQMAALRDTCRTKEIDWQQLKTLLKAQIQDTREGTDKRVTAILEKADNATVYADELGLGLPEKKISRVAPQKPEPAPQAAEKPAHRPDAEPAPRSTLREQLKASIAAAEIPDIPPFLDRRPA